MSLLRRPTLFSLLIALLVAPLSAGPVAAGDASPSRVPLRHARPPLSFVPGDGLTDALKGGRIDEGTYALERVRSLFRPRSVQARYGRVAPAPTHDVTLLMRDLAIRVSMLSGRERRSAERVLARPTDGSNPFRSAAYGSAKAKHKCSGRTPLCFFWAANGRHAPSSKDGNGNGTPDWVETTIDEFENVWDGEVTTLGFRAPKSDSRSQNHGPNGKTDIYLADVGGEQVYGYCTTDDPHSAYLHSYRYPYADVSAYCVVDEDFARSQFPAKDPRTNLQVTAAHEFFHAIQFAYDFYEDAWLMEGTAASMEDEIYDDADDNYQYLAASPLAQPNVPVDRSSNNFFKPSFLNRYGAWIFWRFMTEYLERSGARDPSVIREVWKHADSSRRKKFGDQYSLQAAVAVTKAHGENFRQLFGDFGVLNYVSDSFYEEGAAYLQSLDAQCASPDAPCSVSEEGRPPFTARFALGPNQTTGKQIDEIDHLATSYVRFAPNGASTTAVLDVKLNAPPPSQGASSTLIVFDSSDVPTFYPFDLDDNGNATLTVPFGGASKAVLVMSNGSTKMRCGQQKPRVTTSCQGVPRHDNADYAYTATLFDTP
jgi:hypothetical protein